MPGHLPRSTSHQDTYHSPQATTINVFIQQMAFASSTATMRGSKCTFVQRQRILFALSLTELTSGEKSEHITVNNASVTEQQTQSHHQQ